MQPRVWLNNRQPQTLYIAQLLLYFRGGFALLFTVLGVGFLGVFTLLIAVGEVLAAYGIANSKRWGYMLGVVVAATPLAMRLLRVVVENIAWLRQDLIGLMFDVALLALLLHPNSRNFQRHW